VIYILTGLAGTLLLALLFCEKKESTAGIFITKPSLSFLFVLAAWMQSATERTYGILILSGLVLSLIGDICLIFSSRKMFLSGLIAFLAGHVFYTIAFFHEAAFGIWTGAGLLVVAAIGFVIRSWLYPFLGGMLGPVTAYIVVISIMVSGAASVLGDCQLQSTGRWLVFPGAISFYLSDIFVARQQFVKDAYLNRAVGLPLYYLGQFLLAFSIGRL